MKLQPVFTGGAVNAALPALSKRWAGHLSMKVSLFILASWILIAITGYSASYTINIPGGDSLIANQLDNGANTLDEVLPVVPDGSTIRKWNCGGFDHYTYDSLIPGWFPGGGTLKPGEGAFFHNPGAAFNLTFTGDRHTPVLPPPMPCGCNQENLVSRQTTNAPSSFTDILGFPPADGTTLRRWSGSAYITYTRIGGAWSPSSPTVNRGESVFVTIPCSNQCLVVTCASNKTVECGSNWNFDPPMVEDSCCGTNFTVSILSTVVSNQGPCLQFSTRTWQIADCISNSTTCSQTVTQRDTIPPVLVCPANLNVQCVSEISARPTTLAQFLAAGGSASDNCDTNLAYSSSDSPLSGGVCGGTVIRTHTVTDDCTNSASCVQIIRVWDTIPPVLVCPANLNVQCASAIPARPATLAQFLTAGGSASDNCDTNLAYSSSDSPLSGGACGGTVIRTHTVTDDCTNSASCLQIITVRDTIPPFIVCPPDRTREWVSGSVPDFDVLTFSDNCDTNLTVTFVDNELPASCPAVRIFQRTWTATDDCTNRASCSQRITFRDTTPPVLVCPTNLILQCTNAIPARPAALAQFLAAGGSASDNCDTNLAYSSSDSPLTGGVCGGTVRRTHTVTDDCTNSASCVQIITVRDTTPPVLTCASNKTVECGSAWTFDPPSVLDTCCGSNVNLVVTGTTTNVGPCASTYMRTWQATDCCTNTATCSQTVTVRDTTPPVLSCATNKTVECGSAWTFDPPVASDLCCGNNLTYRFLGSNLVSSTQCQSLWSGRWQVSDCCSNFSGICTQLVTVVDTSAPSITCVSNKTVECGTDWSFDLPTAVDDCGRFVASLDPGQEPGGMGGTGSGTGSVTVYGNTLLVNVTFSGLSANTTAAHIHGPAGPGSNAAVLSPLTVTPVGTTAGTINQAVTLVDGTGGVSLAQQLQQLRRGLWYINIHTTSHPGGEIRGQIGSDVEITVVSTVTNVPPVPCPNLFGVTRTWRAMDACTNSAFCSQTVTVRDTTPPALTCASNKTVECGSAWSFDLPSAFDLCCGTNVTVAHLSTVTNRICPWVITRTWRVTDCCTNSAMCSQTVTVENGGQSALAWVHTYNGSAEFNHTPSALRVAVDASGNVAVTGSAYVRHRIEGQSGYDYGDYVGSSRVDLQACKLEYSIVSPK